MNQYEITFVADTASAVASVRQLEGELVRLQAQLGAVTTAGNNANAAQQAHASGAAAATVGVKGYTESLLNLSNALQVVQGLGFVFGGLAEKIAAGQQKMAEMTEDAFKLRDALREIANLQNHDAPDDEVTTGVLQFGVETGMTPTEARKYMEQFLGSVPAGKTKGNITDAVAEEVAQEGGIFGTRMSINPNTAGDFAGVMSQYQKIGSREEAAKVMGQVAYGLNEGRGNVEPLMRTLLNTAGSVIADGGPVGSLSELAVMEGVASTHANPYATGTRLRQAMRALRTTKGDQGKWLAEHGVKDGMNHLDRLKAIKPALMAEVATTGKGLDQALLEHVTSDDTEARSLAEQLGDIDLMDERLKVMGGITGKGVIEKNRKFLTQSKTGRRRVQMAKKASQEFLVGQQNEDMEIAMENQRQNLTEEKRFAGWLGKADEWVGDAVGYATGQGGYKDRLALGRATKSLIGEARRVGMTDEEIFAKHLGMNPSEILTTAKSGLSAEEVAKRNMLTYEVNRGLRHNDGNKEAFKSLSREVTTRNGNQDGSGPKIVAELQKLNKTNDEQAGMLRKWQVAGPNANRNEMRPGFAGPPRPAAAAPKRP